MHRPSAGLWLLFLLVVGASCRGSGPASSTGGAGAEEGGGDGSSTGSDDTGIVTVPGPTQPWLRDERRAPGPITFTELHFHPAASPDGAAEPEWIELHNPMAFDLDLSGWSLQGGIDWTFAQDTLLGAGEFLVVSADPDALAEQTGFAEALGPYEGQLSNDGERIELVSSGGRLIDTVAWSDEAPWPAGPSSSGFTLTKVDLDAASDHAEHWTTGPLAGGTPGADNGIDPLALPTQLVLIDEDATWSYEASGATPEEGWTEPDFDDSAWEQAQGPFFAGGLDEEVDGTAWVTADNYFALYAGAADGSGMRQLGEDSDASWTSVEEIALTLSPSEHLYVAAWELTGDSTSTQMVIAELELPDDTVGTDVSSWEWVLGPTDDNPGAVPTNPAPDEADIEDLAAAAEADAAWEPPAVESSRGSSPWGSRVSGYFTAAANFIWADTFDADSIANQENTYALFRTVDPAVPPHGEVELTDVPTTVTFRTAFSLEGDPSGTTLDLDCGIDDGAVFYLNGEEALRHNMPTGAIDETTLASDEVSPDGLSEELREELSTDALVRGDNLLAVEVHQFSGEADEDLLFGCTLTAELQPDLPQRTVVLHEVPEAGGLEWVELRNLGDDTEELADLRLWTSGGESLELPDQTLAPDELVLIELSDVSVEEGDRLFLAEDDRFLDAVRLAEHPRARDAEGASWWVPTEPTPGSDNAIELTEDIVIHELMYHRAPLSEEGEDFAERPEEWIELFNRGETEVDLGRWQLADAVSYIFPDDTTLAPGEYLVVARDAEILAEAHPDITVLGDYQGTLSNRGDRVLLRDAVGNPADEVRYFDGGRWPSEADGGGSSLELMDPWADNDSAEAWAPSDESHRTEWTEVVIEGVAGSSAVGPDGQWEELVLGMLDTGEVLIDDLSVVRDPDGAAVDMVQNGTFDADTDAWRLLGTHRHSAVVSDPDDAGNPVLRLVATGPTGHMHNHAETTLTEAISSTATYEISFRARWVSGSNQLHSRLYFHRLPTTTLLPQPATSGTPGAENSTAVDNLGPTFGELAPDEAVPTPDAETWVSVTVDDPDGVEAVDLWASVEGEAFEAHAMSEAGDGVWEVALPGQAAGTLVQIYAEATDALGASSTFPAAGPDSRALYRVDDGLGRSTGLTDFRLLMTAADLEWLHTDINLMSNDLVGATVIYGESEVFWDVGVRLKGSQRGRPSDSRLGYGVRFPDDHPFRGHHTSVMLDRSEGVGFGQREVLLNIVASGAGLPFAEHNDIVQLLAPVDTYTGAAELQLDRYSNLVLDAQFDDGADGTRFEYELVYYPYTTEDDTDEGYKLPQPDTVTGASVTSLGDKEDHRWVWLIKNNARRDDYAGAMALCQLFDAGDSQFFSEADEVLDTEQWLRAFAFGVLAGAIDNYANGSAHNAQFYVRPDDGRVLYLPHDLDFFSSSSNSVVANSDLSRLLEDPAHLRSYYGHLNDIIERSYNTGYMGRWCDQLGELLPDQDFDSHCDFIDDRVDYVQSGSSSSLWSVFPEVGFEITTNGGADLDTEDSELTLEGVGWVDVRSIEVSGAEASSEISWLDEETWQLDVTLEEGENALFLDALDLHGAVVGSDSIVVTVE